MKKNRLLSLLLVLVMLVAMLTACGTPKAETTPAVETPAAEATAEPAAEPAEDAATEPAAEPVAEPEATPETVTVTDMADREVTLPAEINSIATFGSIGVINAFVELMGYGDKICNEMTANFTKSDKWAMQYEFAPQIKDAPVLQNADGDILIEEVLALNPDLCLVMSKDLIEPLESNGLNVIYFEWKKTEDVKAAVTLMGEVLSVPEVAADYLAYFDAMVAEAEEKTAGIAEADRKTALYGSVISGKNPHVISEWWLTTAGAKSATAEAWVDNSCAFTQEDVLLWNPDVIISSGDKIDEIMAESTYSDVNAIKNEAVYMIPTVAHVWGNRTVEQPLTIFWTMNKLYPEIETNEDLAEKIVYFYEHFFKTTLTEEQVAKIIG